jgi:4-amino-4-deoxychorismate lyase
MRSSGFKTGAMVNGVWQDQPSVSISDSGLSYGLALFETMRVSNGEIPLLAGHISRLSKSLKTMLIPEGTIDLAMSDLAAFISSLEISDAVVRLTLTAGEAGRGYALAKDRQASRILQAFELPTSSEAPLTLGIAETRLSSSPILAGLKHSNRVEQVLARQELAARREVDDLLLLDASGDPIEAISSNLFLVHGDSLSTPDLSHCGVEGVMKARIIERLTVVERKISIDELQSADEILLTNALGIKRVTALNLGSANLNYQLTDLGDQLMDILPW